ncbi:hypothetical protein ACEPAF_8951 [Sanghuangporus sanghuang]
MPTASSRCHLLTLPDELIFEILSYCPVENILKLEGTCKRMYQICRSHAIWRSLVQRLDVSQAPSTNPFHSIESLPEPELRWKVINAVQRHRVWTTPGNVPPMRVLELPLPHIEESRIMKTRLLPGGKEILISNHGSVEFWSIESMERLWSIPAPEDHIDTVGFDFDIVDNGEVLAIAIVCEDAVFPDMSLLRLYNYTFANRSVNMVLERRLPTLSPSRIMLQGEFFISSIPRLFQSVVLNWRSGSALILDFADPMRVRTDVRSKLVADNNLIVFLQEAELGFCAAKLPLSALNERWSDEVNHNAWQHVLFRSLDRDYSLLPLPYSEDQDRAQNGNAGYGLWVLAHHIFKPSWQPDAPTEIFVVAYTVTPGGRKPMRLISFRLQLSHSEGQGSERDSGTLKLVRSSSAPIGRLPRNPRNVSNTGLMFSLRQKLQVITLFSEDGQPISEVDLGADVIPEFEEFDPNVSSVDPWSGAIAVRILGSMKVLYFD